MSTRMQLLQATLLCLCTGLAHAAGYIKFDGVDGETKKSQATPGIAQKPAPGPLGAPVQPAVAVNPGIKPVPGFAIVRVFIQLERTQITPGICSAMRIRFLGGATGGGTPTFSSGNHCYYKQEVAANKPFNVNVTHSYSYLAITPIEPRPSYTVAPGQTLDAVRFNIRKK